MEAVEVLIVSVSDCSDDGLDDEEEGAGWARQCRAAQFNLLLALLTGWLASGKGCDSVATMNL